MDEMDMVDWKEGVHISSGGGSIGLIKGGPHPNAAKVFINWFLSRAARSLCKNTKIFTAKTRPTRGASIFPKDMLPRPAGWSKDGVISTFPMPKHSDMTPIFQLVKEFMKGREGK